MFIYIEREKERKRERDRVLKLVVYSTWASGVSSSMTEPLDCDVAGRDRGFCCLPHIYAYIYIYI